MKKFIIFVWGIMKGLFKMDEKKENVLQIPFKDTKEVVSVFIAFGKAYETSMVDGKIDGSDLKNLWPVVWLVKPALSDISQVKLEFINATEEDKNEFEAWVKTQIDLKDKSVEQLIEASFALVLDLAFFLQAFFPRVFDKPVTKETNGTTETPVE